MSEKSIFEYDKVLEVPMPVTRQEIYLYQIVKRLQDISDKLDQKDGETGGTVD